MVAMKIAISDLAHSTACKVFDLACREAALRGLVLSQWAPQLAAEFVSAFTAAYRYSPPPFDQANREKDHESGLPPRVRASIS